MRIGMTLPSMVAGYDRRTTLDWCRRVDDGPFSSISCGERITYHNQEILVLLSAAAALTERVRIVPSVFVLPMHQTAWIAKQIATLDVLSGGRVTVGVGIGGREQDYQSVGASASRRHQRLDKQVAELKRLWAGESPFDGAPAVGPAPVQKGGPPLLAGALGPKAIGRAAVWAEGIAGFSLDADIAKMSESFRMAEAAWKEAEREAPPRCVMSFWFALGPDGEARLHDYARSYLAIYGERAANAMAGATRMHSAGALRGAISALESIGCDELILVPTTVDVTELDRLLDVIA